MVTPLRCDHRDGGLTTLTRGELEQHYASATAQEDEMTAGIDAEVARRAAEVQPPPEAGRCMLC